MGTFMSGRKFGKSIPQGYVRIDVCAQMHNLKIKTKTQLHVHVSHLPGNIKP